MSVVCFAPPNRKLQPPAADREHRPSLRVGVRARVQVHAWVCLRACVRAQVHACVCVRACAVCVGSGDRRAYVVLSLFFIVRVGEDVERYRCEQRVGIHQPSKLIHWFGFDLGRLDLRLLHRRRLRLLSRYHQRLHLHRYECHAVFVETPTRIAADAAPSALGHLPLVQNLRMGT
jgi:hypothetical protein